MNIKKYFKMSKLLCFLLSMLLIFTTLSHIIANALEEQAEGVQKIENEEKSEIDSEENPEIEIENKENPEIDSEEKPVIEEDTDSPKVLAKENTKEPFSTPVYHRGDVQVINNMIKNNALNWQYNAPATWSGLRWHANEHEEGKGRRIQRLNLLNAGVTGSVDFRELSYLVELDMRGNPITELHLTGMKNLRKIRCGMTRLTELDISNLNLDQFDGGSIPTMTSFTMKGSSVITMNFGRQNSLKQFTNVNGDTLIIDRNGPYSLSLNRYHHALGQFTIALGLNESGINNAFTHWTAIPNDVDLVSPSTYTSSEITFTIPDGVDTTVKPWFDHVKGYHRGDVEVINNLITNNALNWQYDAPATWPSDVRWHTNEHEEGMGRRIQRLTLSNRRLTGSVDVRKLEYLESLDLAFNPITELHVSGMKNLKALTCFNNDNLMELDISNLNLETFALAFIPKLTSFTMEGTMVRTFNTFGSFPNLRQFTNTNGATLTIEAKGPGEIIFGTYNHNLKQFTLEAKSSGTNTDYFSHWTVTPSGVNYVSPSTNTSEKITFTIPDGVDTKMTALFDRAKGYYRGDVEVINNMIKNNALNLQYNEPATWSPVVQWHTNEHEEGKGRRIRALPLWINRQRLTGSVDVRKLEYLESMDVLESPITELHVSGMKNLRTLAFGNNTNLKELDISNLNLENFVSFDMPTLASFTMEGTTAIETFTFTGKFPNLRQFTNANGDTLTIEANGPGEIVFGTYNHTLKQLTLEAKSTGTNTDYFSHWTMTPNNVDYVSSSTSERVTFTIPDGVNTKITAWFDLTKGYHRGDVEVINNMIKNNALNLQYNDPATWSPVVQWHTNEHEEGKGRRIRALPLWINRQRLTGSVDVRKLEYLESMDVLESPITELHVSGMKNLRTLAFGNNTNLKEIDISNLNLENFVSFDMPTLASFTMEGTTAIETFTFTGKFPNLRQFTNANGDTLMIEANGPGDIVFGTYNHNLKRFTLEARSTGTSTDSGFSHWTATPNGVNYVSPSTNTSNKITFTIPDGVDTKMTAWFDPAPHGNQ